MEIMDRYARYADLKRNFFNLPINCNINKYEKVLDKFKNVYAAIPDVSSIYRFGNVGVTGISDLDFIIVLKDKVTYRNLNKLFYKKFDPRDRYILDHPPYIVDRETFDNIYKILPVFELEYIYGEVIQFSESHRKDGDYQLALLNDELLLSIPRDYFLLSVSPRIDVRHCLGKINALKYPITMVTKITGECPKLWIEFTENFQDFRKNWFNFGDDRNYILLDFVKGSLEICCQIISIFQRIMFERCLNQGKYSGLYGREPFYTQFVQDWNATMAIDNMLEFYDKTKKVVNVLPGEAIIQYILFSQGEGIVSQLFKNYLEVNFINYNNHPTVSPLCNQTRTIFAERISLINNYFDFINRNRLYCNTFRGFGYIPPFGIRGMVKSISSWFKCKTFRK